MYTICVLATWAGYALALRCAWLVFLLLSRRADVDRPSVLRGVVVAAVGAVGCLLFGRAGGDPVWFDIPLVWWVMPFCAWLAVISLAMAVGVALQSTMTLTRESRVAKWRSAALWLVVFVFGVWLYRRDPENTVSVLKGGIPLTLPTATLLIVIALGSVAVMALTARMAGTRRFAKGVATQLALVAGSIVFGVPLLFLLVTSFKEDRDMSSANGIIWVPRVQRTMPYFDPANPIYETGYQEQTIQATITTRSPDGTVKLDINKPLSLRGLEVDTKFSDLKLVPRDAPLVTATIDGVAATGLVVEDMEDGRERVRAISPPSVKGKEAIFTPDQLQPVRDIGLRWQNYTEALSYLPPETVYGLVFLRNTLIIAILSVIGTILSSSLAAYAFARMRFPGRDAIFAMFLATMMLPAAVTMMPQFLIFRDLGWIDTLLPLWAPAFVGSALNIFLLRQFFRTIPIELEDAAKIDGCTYVRTFWQVMLPQIKPALAVIGVTTFMGAWNNFMGPLIYINSSEKMPISYALQLFMGDRGGEPGLLMAFVALTIIPVLLLFFFAQRYFIEGVTLSGFGGR
jgi:multiple sugar transport system permease protein